MSNIKFDHTNNNFHDAIGLSKNEIKELLEQAKKIIKNMDKEKKSVVVEEILNVINDMNHKELSVIIFLVVSYMQHRISGVLLDELVKMKGNVPSPPPRLPDSDDKFNPSYM